MTLMLICDDRFVKSGKVLIWHTELNGMKRELRDF